MKFEAYRISPQIKENLERKGLKRPTDIQFKTIPHVLAGEDVLAIAQTGTGKTAAFVIPILHKLSQQSKQGRKKVIACLVLAPTHELAEQITNVFNELGKGTGISAMTLIGGVDQAPQIKRLEDGIDVLVATPGRIFDLVNQGFLNLSQASILVVDEADHMLDLGFYRDIMDLQRHLPKYRQTLYFSATIDQKIKKLAYSLVNNPIRIQISPKDPVSKNVTHHVTHIEMDDKRFFLERLINENPEQKVLVFVRTKVRAERVLKAMDRVNIKSVTIHSDKTQAERNEAMRLFKSGECLMMIATDVSARGIDIPSVDIVVNYDMPEQAENYVHRIGRTGRGKLKGNAVSFCSQEELPMLKEIEAYIGKPIEEIKIKKLDYLETLDFTSDTDSNWKSVMKEAAQEELNPTVKPKKKKTKGKKKR